jgi:hypothetical protein
MTTHQIERAVEIGSQRDGQIPFEQREVRHQSRIVEEWDDGINDFDG